ncbi:MAG: PD40 domain-containing protein [Bacteroidia bacterium]|nr:PD40 domain-containing protein [Bacteroidia bacterium]
MSRVLSKLFLIALLLTVSGQLNAQSKNAYLRAGDDCMAKNDPFCAIGHYKAALDYAEDADVYARLCAGEKALHNYKEAINWAIRCMQKVNGLEEKISIYQQTADLYKRTGNFTAAQSCIDTLLRIDTARNEYWKQLKADYTIAENVFADTLSLQLIHEPGDVNTAYSDFAPAALGDSLLIYSSLRYSIPDVSEKISTSRIATINTKQANRAKSVLLPPVINQASFNDANATISADGKIMIFSRCLYDDAGKLRCALYESKLKNGQWTEAIKLSSEINPNGKSSTQPCIATNKSEGYLLFFSSDKSGGNGGMDIWITQRLGDNKYSKPENAGKKVNTAGDEWTPFYDVELDSLYFAGERTYGLGGLDLYQISYSKIKSDSTRLLPQPYNSGYNDLYYTRSYGAEFKTYLVTNRPPATRLNGSSCCYDIFRLEPLPPPVVDTATVIDSIPVLVANNSSNSGLPDFKDSTFISKFSALPATEQLSYIRAAFPIRLYFDNDHPDPRSGLSTTKSVYDVLAINYLKKKEEYIRQQSSDSLIAGITHFFDDSVSTNFDKLERFTLLLTEVLKKPNLKLKITITGSASPLAESRYNVILSNRRIRSLENYWRRWKNGELSQAFTGNKLEIVFIPAGEEKAQSGVSDNIKDLSRSVYSRDAALERRIELSEIEIIE